MLKLTGILPALLTPFDDDDKVNAAVIRDMVEFHLSAGVSGFYLTGSTGEGLLLSEAERALVVETVVNQVNGRVPVVVHVGALTTAAAAALAGQAESAGADGISSIPPIYFSVGPGGVKQYYERIAAASSLPFYVYNIPGATGIDVGVDMMADLMTTVPTLRGMKYTSYNFFEMRRIIEMENGCLNIVSGPDELMIAAQAMGADGAIGSTYNLLPHLFVQAYDAFNTGDIARARDLQAKGNRVISVFLQFLGLSGLKEMMRFIGFDCGTGRQPLMPLSSEDNGRMREMLEEIGFFDFAETRSG